MPPFPTRSSSFGERALANHLLFASMAVIVLGWSALTSADGVGTRFTQANFDALARFIDYKQVGIPIAGGFFLYLVISVLSHQSRSHSAEARGFHWRELIHAEISSVLLSSSSLALVVGGLFCWAGLFAEGLKTASWWPVGLLLAHLLRPKTQDRYAV
jgi:hypothetical protein